jgi:exodeoxyribonuclease V beta subunit
LLEDSGLLFRQTESRDWDRKYTNYRQIFEHLEGVAYRKNLDFRGISALLDGYRKQSREAEDDADIHQIETEARKVRIMTMHVSKGLQFPVVFIAGGLTRPFVDDYHVYHVYSPDKPGAGVRKVIDLSKKYDKRKHDREKIDEDKRLYYVALTRSQFKLYVPFFPDSSSKRWVGPVCRFLSSAVSSAFSRNDDGSGIGWILPDTRTASAPEGPGKMGPEVLPEEAVQTFDALLPSNNNYLRRKVNLDSFSSLRRRRHSGPADLGQSLQETGFQVVRDKHKEDDESFAFFDSDGIGSAHPGDEMPGGSEIGLMFHDILERIEFGLVAENAEDLLGKTETRDVIVSAMDTYGVDDRWQPEVCRTIAKVLTTPVSTGRDVLVLGDLGKKDRIHEVEFCYPFNLSVDLSVDASGGRKFKIPECEIDGGRRGFIRGFIDLVFQHNGKYFIADWKSNHLDNGYDRSALESSMTDAGYHLQYKLYTIAVLRWLKKARGDCFDAGRHFGGVFYFYLRGMGTGDGAGVYFVPPAVVGGLAELETEIEGLISNVD